MFGMGPPSPEKVRRLGIITLKPQRSLVGTLHRSDLLPDLIVHLGAEFGQQFFHPLHLGIEHPVLHGHVFNVRVIDDEVGEYFRLVLLHRGGGVVIEEAGELGRQDGGSLQVLGGPAATAVLECGLV